MTKQDINKLADLIGSSDRILIFTGAGISTASGIPDFRGPQGVWKTRQPVYFQDFISSESARIEHWDFKLETWELCRDIKPTNVHDAIVDLERAGKLLTLVTQNIDGLHHAAGTSRDLIVELHGTNALIECLSCGELTDPAPHFETFKNTGKPPVCHCGGLLKSATISFGQSLRENDLIRADRAARECDLIIALGSTLSVSPANMIPLTAANRGVPYVIINQGPTDHDDHPSVVLRLDGDVQELFPAAVS